MTNKEALAIVSCGGVGFTYETFLEAQNLLLKDLEVLELLKKYYKSDGWSNGGVIEFWKMSEEQLNKIKERLENE